MGKKFFKPPRHYTSASAAHSTVIMRKICELKLSPRNPRIHSKRQIRQIARSIKAFGFNVPVLIDASGNVIAGHGRILACTLLGWTEVPTISLDHLSEAQARAFMIADNRLTEISVWDDRLLAEELQQLSLLELNFELEDIGFDTGEIDFRIQGLNTQRDGKDDPADAIPQISGPAISRVGDLWLLDDHRVLCGSALDASAYTALMQGELAATVNTDPPYNTRIGGHVSGLGAIRHREFVMASGEMSEAEFIAFLTQVCSLLTRHSVDGSLHYLFMDWRHLYELLTAGRQVYTDLMNVAIWVKSHTGMGGLYRSRHELIVIFKHGRAPHWNNVQLGKFGRDRTNVWHYSDPRTPSDEGNLLRLHPTVKSASMIADAIIDCTRRGDIVLDPFLGSGTTVIAAERTDRRCYGLELDPLYVDTIVRRWQAFTRGTARHAANGKTFDEIQAAREADNDRTA